MGKNEATVFKVLRGGFELLLALSLGWELSFIKQGIRAVKR